MVDKAQQNTFASRWQATRDFFREAAADLADDGRINSSATVLKETAARSLAPVLAWAVDGLEGVKIPGLGSRPPKESQFATLVSVSAGSGQSHNQNDLSQGSGRPEGRGDASGSTRVVSFGKGGSGVSVFDHPVFTTIVVFGNEFKTNGKVLDPEAARVEVSPDGPEVPDAQKRWYPLLGEAGRNPTTINSQNMLDPFDPQAGGTTFTLAMSVPSGMGIRCVRVTDLGTGTTGFDLAGIAGR